MSDPYDPDNMPRSMPRGSAPSPHQPHQRFGDELIIRIDERTRQMAEEIKGLKEVVVTRGEFAPVRMIVFGLVGLMLSSIIVIILLAAYKGK